MGFCLSSALELQSDRAISIVAPDNLLVGSAELAGPNGLYQLLNLVGPEGLYQHSCLTTFEACCAQLQTDGQLSMLFERDVWIYCSCSLSE
eukprot:scaffold76788_cov47-Cyclotella_meneghiniana.AAC.2